MTARYRSGANKAKPASAPSPVPSRPQASAGPAPVSLLGDELRLALRCLAADDPAIRTDAAELAARWPLQPMDVEREEALLAAGDVAARRLLEETDDGARAALQVLLVRAFTWARKGWPPLRGDTSLAHALHWLRGGPALPAVTPLHPKAATSSRKASKKRAPARGGR